MSGDGIEVMDCYSSGALLCSRTCVCAVLSGDALDAARAARAAGEPSGCRLSFFSPDEAGRSRLIEEAGRRGVLVAGCVPVQESLTLWLSAPFSSVAKARKVFPSLLDIALPFPLEKCVYQFLDVRRMPDKTTGGLAVAARRDRVEALLQRYRSAGVDPHLLDHEGLALWTQSLREMPLQAGATRVVLCLADERATLVVGHGGRFMNAHSVLSAAGAGPADSLADLIRRHVRAEVEPAMPVQWVFCGAGAKDRSLVQSLHDNLSDEWPGPSLLHREPESFLPRALAARVLHREPLRCNLRCGSLTHNYIRKIARRLAFAGAWLLLGSGLLLCGMNAAWHSMGSRRFERIKRDVAALAGAIAPGERIPYGMEAAEVGKAMERHAGETAPFLEAFAPSLSERLADIIKAGIECKITVETMTLRRGNLAIAGTAEDWDQCGAFAKRLRAMGYTVALDRKEAVADGPVRFALKGEVAAR